MSALHGVGVLVTRPEQQAMPLCRLLEAQGAHTLRLPAIEIKPIGDRRETAAQLGALEDFDLIIFASANAVRFGAALLDQKRDLMLAAIGPATARALNQAGYRVRCSRRDPSTPKGLLRHPRLEHPAGRRILLIKGSNGRPLLEQELARRGAQVVARRRLRRVPAVPSARGARRIAGELQRRRGAGDHRDQRRRSPAICLRWRRLRCAVSSNACIGWCRARGWHRRYASSASRRRCCRRESAEDQDLVAALMRWRSSASGA